MLFILSAEICSTMTTVVLPLINPGSAALIACSIQEYSYALEVRPQSYAYQQKIQLKQAELIH